MLILALDTSMACCSAGVYDTERGSIVAAQHQFMGRGQAEALAPLVGQVMAQAALQFSDINRIAVTTGPGTFTGVRIGLAFARGLGVSLGVSVVGINSFCAIAANESKRPLLVAVDARMGEIYAATFTGDGSAILPPHISTIDGLTLPHAALVIGTGADAILQKFGNLSLQRSKAGDLPLAENFVRLTVDLSPLDHPPDPLYLRAPDVKLPAAQQNSFMLADNSVAKLLAEIHGECFASAWDEAAIGSLLSTPGMSATLMSKAHTPTGFIVFRTAADEAEIITICVRPAFRQHGLAMALMQKTFDQLKAQNITSLFIEVGRANLAALALYAACGFENKGVRKDYYDLGQGRREDALIMAKSLEP